ncbi:MAG: DUF6288 domain-containing protein [bacterium]
MRSMTCVIGWMLLGGGVMAAETVPARLQDFTQGDKPGSKAVTYSLLGCIGGNPNGVEKKGRDGNQIYVATVAKGAAGNALLQVGDVILGVNGTPFNGDVIETLRAATEEAPLRSKDGNLRLIRWRNGTTETLDYLTVVPPPDLTESEAQEVDRTLTYNLGPTGLRGWIHTKALTALDGKQGRTTAASRQILVTHVGTNSPACGVVEVNDVILGVSGKRFSDDARKSFGRAITEAEKTENKGVLTLTRFRAGKAEEVPLKLKVMGSYSDTAPYDCPKSKLILADACKVLENEPLSDSLWGAINGLALLSSGNPDYLPKVQAFARSMAAKQVSQAGGGAWDCGYKNVFLSEYYLLTGDQEVLPGIHTLTVKMAKGQGMYGTFGHGFSDRTPDGKLHGSIPPYGPVNQAGLIANLGIIMGKKCGATDPEIDPAIGRACQFFTYFVDKGTVPYGEHMPWPYHENNGKSALAAVLFAVQGGRAEAAQFFARMSTAAYESREYGHTGQGFGYLWSALGANVGGPDAAAAFFKEAQWHLDLVRRCDGSFTYDGGEQFGAGRTDDNTYYGQSSYCGLSPAATYVLTYSMPLRKLLITGRGADKAVRLSKKDVQAAIASGRFDVDCRTKSAQELVAAFSDWSPVVRGWAAEELAKRPEAKGMVPELINMAEGKDLHIRQGACEALGCIKDARALPVLVRLLKHDDRWLRVKAANALKKMDDAALPVLTDMLQAVVDTTEPLQPIIWADPIQLTHGELAAALFDGLMRKSIEGIDRKLLYPAIRAVSRNADGMATACLVDTFGRLTLEDVQALAPDILAAAKDKAPADTMFGNELRMAAVTVLAKYHYKEGVRALMDLAKVMDPHGSEVRIPIILKLLQSYGAAGRETLPELKGLLAEYQQSGFPKDCNVLRIAAAEEAIASIEAANGQPELRSLTK